MEAGKANELEGITDQEVVLIIPNSQEPPKPNTMAGGSYSDTRNVEPSISPETSIRRRLLAPSRSSKPKSRLVEPPPLSKLKPSRRMVSTAGEENHRAGSITAKTPLMSSTGGENKDDNDNEVYKPGWINQVDEKEMHGRKVKFLIFIEWISFLAILGFLVVSLSIDKVRIIYVSGLHIWRWCVLVLAVLCGHLISEWLTSMLVFVIERNFVIKNKVLYFLYSLRKSFQVCLWLGLILLAWVLLINHGVKRSWRTMRVLDYITRGLVSSLLGAILWMLKTLLVKLLASSYHVRTYFDKIQDSVFHQHVLETLSGPAIAKRTAKSGGLLRSGKLSFKYSMNGKQKGKGDVVDVEKLHRLKKEMVSSWTMGGLVHVIRTSGLSTISDKIDMTAEDEDDVGQKEIASEYEAKDVAKTIFKSVAKADKEYIDEEDLLCYFPIDEVDDVLMQFPGAAESGEIEESSFKSWVIKAYNERKYLAHSLNDAKTAIEELNKLGSGIVIVIIIVVWLLMMGLATTKILLLITSQILLFAFMFGNFAKTVFEAMMFVFVTHPFDVGDRCGVDGVKMDVEEMNIMTTVFLTLDNQIVYYPNSVLSTKPIYNYSRSPPLSDSIDFCIDFSTSVQSIAALKDRIKWLLEGTPHKWQAKHTFLINEIEDMNKLKMCLTVTHATNSADRMANRSDLVMQLKILFEEIGIKYHLLPQEVQVRYLG